MFDVGETVVTTVHMIGGRQAEVRGSVTGRNMSRKDSTRVLSYVIDASDAGYGSLLADAAKVRTPEGDL